MKRILIFLVFVPLVLTCKKEPWHLDSFITGRIIGYDLNCSTCIMEFPEDPVAVKESIGESKDNYYVAVNLNKDNYEIGQQIKVRIRKPETNELNYCITLYPSSDYRSVYVEELKDFGEIVYSDTLSLAWHDCLTDIENRYFICLDSVVNDSRCPTGLECLWAGMANVRLRFQKYNGSPVYFDLLALLPPNSEKIIDGFKFKLIELEPYPSADHYIIQKDYKVRLVVTKEN